MADEENGLAGLLQQNVAGSASISPAELRRILDTLGLLGGTRKAPGEETGLYWDARHPSQGGTQRVGPSIGAPSADHYRLVDSMEEANDVIGRGEKPLLVGNLQGIDPEQIDPAVLRQLQEDQWAAPGGTPLFGDAGNGGGGLQGLVRR